MAFETRQQIEERIKNSARRAFQKAAPADGVYKFKVTKQNILEQPSKGDKDGKGAGCITVALTVAPLRDPEDSNSVAYEYETTKWLTLNIVNPAVENHTVDSTTDNKTTADLSAMVPDRVPHVSLKLPSGEWDNTPATKAAKNNAIIEAAVVSTEIAAGDLDLTDSYFVANTKKGEKGYFLNSMRAELRAGEQFTSLETSN